MMTRIRRCCQWCIYTFLCLGEPFRESACSTDKDQAATSGEAILSDRVGSGKGTDRWANDGDAGEETSERALRLIHVPRKRTDGCCPSGNKLWRKRHTCLIIGE